MYALGVNHAYHESAACLVHDGRILAAAEEERFTRVKHGKAARVDNPHELPVNAIDYCMEEAGITLADVDHIGSSILPAKRLRNSLFTDRVAAGDWGGPGGETTFYDHLQTVPARLREMGFQGQFHWLSHHLCHAASAYYPAPFDRAAVLAVDGIGETASTMVALGESTRLSPSVEISYPASIGFLWEKIAKYLGFSEYDACKVMGLAAYGDPAPYRDHYRHILKLLPDGQFSLDNDVLRFRMDDYSGLTDLFGLGPRPPHGGMSSDYADITAALQAATDDVMLHLARHAARSLGTRNLCMAGGVALNCVANGRIAATGWFDNLYIQPAAHDAGTALGAALLIWHHVLGGPERDEMRHAHYGPHFTEADIEAALQEHGAVYKRVDDIAGEVARLLADQKIVGWFQGRMEFGPRALGNRSLLADPRHPAMRERLNRVVKNREDFRPFAPSVLAEHARQWFDIPTPSRASDFMLIGYRALQPEKIAAVVHIDGTSRIQTVHADLNPRFHQLISHFHRITGIPLVLNTSFNDREPIVCTPADAITTLHRANIDYLAIGDFLVEPPPTGPGHSAAMSTR
ncbi:carbamoyltransferase [Streptomyces sp. NBC_00996]|uniref:carbamoyltransferase family protein n=1 Tax=Streptomyces sp. NBC_00996 TaxID=2903710 RepID=UPI00386E1BB1|nr:carbamoyltransferase [Streptomyces sp. NBC_00996]